jgi:hypothetical protein
MRYAVQCFPRSGANFFANNLSLSCDRYVGISHEPRDMPHQTTIHIVRNPIDSISSIIWVNEQLQGEVDTGMGIPSQIENYIKMYKFILSRNNYIICFDKLIADPDKTISDWLEHRGVEYTKKTIQKTVDVPTIGFHSSSRDNPRYQEIYEAVSNYKSREFDQCHELYTKALALCH